MSENDVQQLTSISKASTYEEIAEFWDTHSLADYWDQTYEVEFEVRIPRRVSIEADLFARIAEESRRRGISSETLVNLWLAERLQGLAMPSPTPIQHEEVAAAQREMQLAEANEAYSTDQSQA